MEGVDYSRVEDPFWQRFAYHNTSDSPNLHRMPTIRALRGGKLRAGETVSLDYYALVPVYQGTAASCLTHPAIRDYMEQSMVRTDRSLLLLLRMTWIFHTFQGFFRTQCPEIAWMK